MDIISALGKVREQATQDPFNDELWTADGNVRMDVVEKLVGSSVTRQDVINAAPKFVRANMELPGDAPRGSDDQLTTPVDALDAADGTATQGAALEAFLEAGPMSPRQFAAYVRELDDDMLGPVRDLMDGMINEVGVKINELQNFRDEQRQNRQILKAAIDARTPNTSDRDAIREFLDSQAAVRAQRHEAATEVKKLVKSAIIDPRSALDKAMARKNQRFGVRPNRS